MNIEFFMLNLVGAKVTSSCKALIIFLQLLFLRNKHFFHNVTYSYAPQSRRKLITCTLAQASEELQGRKIFEHIAYKLLYRMFDNIICSVQRGW